ncbi:MAG: class I tRNA ligase family protein, partial [Candidatus Paceibacterota bacterium]
MDKETKQIKSDAALREEKILEFWKENKIFDKSLEYSEGRKEFIFYEGPPTANGKPGIHHLEARAFKDAIPRYKTMRGFHVRRKGGWDTHGLPVELQVEKKLGLNSKKAIEEYGIAKFNQECKENVWEYLDVWNRFTKRIGYWVDQDNAYVTYHNDYIESVWNVVKKVDDQGLLYKDYRIVPWCPRCGTALSSHELAQGYEDVKDLSVTAKFKIISGQKNSPASSSEAGTFRDGNFSTPTYLLAWTTTPWTLPGNVALAVGEDIDYVKVKSENEILILAKERISILMEQYEIVEEMKGKDLIGLKYEPLFPFLKEIISETERPKLEKAFQVYGADFVTTVDGTGVVHTAVMYGQDDFVLGTKLGLPKHHLVGLDGRFLEGTGIFAGRMVKDEDVAVDIIKDLAHCGLLFKKEKYEHSYPHCWRCKTPLIYYARDSWYIRMSSPKIKAEMIKENKEINWEPAHIRDGRFGEWLREIKDWAISRERYWGTPLPIWEGENGKKIVIDSIETLKKYSKKSGNKYLIMRHGGSEWNKRDMISYKDQAGDHLTEEGIKEVRQTAKNLATNKIDLIISSPFARTRETAELVQAELGLSADAVLYDERLKELNPGELDGKSWHDYHGHVSNVGADWFERKILGGDSFQEVVARIGSCLYEIESKYKGKNILFVTHGAPAWLFYVVAGLYLPNKEDYKIPNSIAFVEDFKKFDNAEVRELPFVPLPHDESFELNLHKPYIDDIELVDENGTPLKRIKEVMDVWFDSGCMPFAEDHYPFENRNWVEGKGYPADYISEAIDQTRGWFYTLHAVGILMGRGKAYKNVICLGHLLDAKGKKMSKSLGNIVEPFEAMDKYGVDTLRLWMYSVNQPGESKNFDEKTVVLLHQQVFGLLYNILAFYELYRGKEVEKSNRPNSKNILDVWIIARLDELTELATKNLDNYKLLEPTRAIRDFVGDLSTWYLRRSRERIKEGDKDAKQTLYFVLRTLAKLLAPFAPFAAEDIWRKLRSEDDKESVHLESWPVAERGWFSFGKTDVIKQMQEVREIVTLGLEARQKAGIRVRQPLAKLEVKNFSLKSEYVELIKDEINVKELRNNNNLENEVMLDTEITEDLKREGDYRELVRGVQDMRKSLGLTPSDPVNIYFDTDEAGRKLVEKFESEMRKTVLAQKIEFGSSGGEEVKIGELEFKI